MFNSACSRVLRLLQLFVGLAMALWFSFLAIWVDPLFVLLLLCDIGMTVWFLANKRDKIELCSFMVAAASAFTFFSMTNLIPVGFIALVYPMINEICKCLRNIYVNRNAPSTGNSTGSSSAFASA